MDHKLDRAGMDLRKPLIFIVTHKAFAARRIRSQILSLGYARVGLASPNALPENLGHADLLLADPSAANARVLPAIGCDWSKVIVLGAPNHQYESPACFEKAKDVLGSWCTSEELRLKLDRFFQGQTAVATPPDRSNNLLDTATFNRLVRAARSGQAAAFIARLVPAPGCGTLLFNRINDVAHILGRRHPMVRDDDGTIQILLKVGDFAEARAQTQRLTAFTKGLPRHDLAKTAVILSLRTLPALNGAGLPSPKHQTADDIWIATLAARSQSKTAFEKIAA